MAPHGPAPGLAQATRENQLPDQVLERFMRKSEEVRVIPSASSCHQRPLSDAAGAEETVQ